MLITDDGRVKLMDFGMARLASHDSKATPLVRHTRLTGRPSTSWAKPAGRAAPIFSPWAVVLYEMVTGKRPFDAESLQAICGRVLSSDALCRRLTPNPSRGRRILTGHRCALPGERCGGSLCAGRSSRGGSSIRSARRKETPFLCCKQWQWPLARSRPRACCGLPVITLQKGVELSSRSGRRHQPC